MAFGVARVQFQRAAVVGLSFLGFAELIASVAQVVIGHRRTRRDLNSLAEVSVRLVRFSLVQENGGQVV